MLSLIALAFPPLGFLVGLSLLAPEPGNAWMRDPRAWPWELWVLAVSGSVATLAGLLDHRFHRNGGRTISRKERISERWALLAGGGVFLCLATASVRGEWKRELLLPLLVGLVTTVVLIAYDEFLFHRKVGFYEGLLHRLLVFGNGLAFLAWMHWCYVRDAAIT